METGCPEEVWDKYIMEVDKGFRLVEGDAILRDFMTPGKGIVNDNRNDKFEFRVDLVPGATPVAKSPYRLAPLEMQELSEQLQEMHDEELELLKKERLYAKTSIKDKILATPSETSKVVNTPAEMLRDLDQHMEKRADDGCKANVVIEALRRKEQVKPRRVRAMAMTIQFGVRGMILAAQSKAFKQENVCAERLHGSKYSVHPRADKMYHDLRDMYWSPILWAEIGERSLIGPELVQEMTDKVVLIKEKLKAARKIGPVAYRLRLPEELSGSTMDMFHVSKLEECLSHASLPCPLDEIKVDKTLRFVEEPIEIMDREVKRLKRMCSEISLM
ncbi:hypothetical protein Tco_1449388 [Tanacetum coccineum]